MSSVMLIRAQQDRIQINPFELSGDLYPLVDNGNGEEIEDKDDSPVEIFYTNPVRISFEKKYIKRIREGSTPITYEKRTYFMISDNQTIVDIRLEFIYNGVSLKIIQRKEIRKYNNVIGYEYELKDITEGNTYG